ncbi:MAG: hypothetical protein PHF67_01680 [Candidatus Nanoarchaeia archaeon]|nr:hypothetical protein [Candidatus Nanoarchaeia archaeon]
MPVKKRGTKKSAREDESILNETPISEKVVYDIENKPELKETPVVPINQPEQSILKESPVMETSEKKPIRKEVRVLVILVIILLIIDCLSLYLYYKPDLSDIFKFRSGGTIGSPNSSNKCQDGTAYDNCSKDKPLYCYNGELIKKAATCGCPSGYKVDFQDCKKV